MTLYGAIQTNNVEDPLVPSSHSGSSSEDESDGFLQNMIETAATIFVQEPFDLLKRHDSLASVIDEKVSAKDTVNIQSSFHGHASIPSEIANLMKNIIGCGVLSLSGGIAMFANSPSAVLSAAFWIVLLGAMFGYLCVLIGKICQMTGVATYRELGILTMGPKGAIAMSVCNMFKPALADLAYSTILSQTFQSLLETVGIEVSNVTALLIVTIVGILPLCLLKNLHVLAPFSVLGSIGIVFTAIAMIIRCLDGTYAPGGMYADPDLDPGFGTENHAFSPKAFPFVCMVFEAWVMHYNAPRFYTELRDASIPRFSRAVGWSFGLSSIVYIAIAGAGYMTFGTNVDSYVLNNYSPQDPLATASRLAVGLSTLFNYPLAFIGFRDGVVDLLMIFTSSSSPSSSLLSSSSQGSKSSSPPIDWTKYLNVLTVVLLSLVTITAIFVTDLGLINSVGGGTLATATVFVFPAVMYRVAVEQDSTSKYYVARRREVVFVMALMVFGVVLGLTGVWVAIRNDDQPAVATKQLR
jgi:amino acid permease